MTQYYSPARAGTPADTLAKLIARRMIPIGCAMGLAVSAQAFAVDSPPGAKLGDEFLVNATDEPFDPAIAVDADGDFVVAWTSYDQDGYGIYAQRYGADGSAVGDEFQVNTTTTGDQSIPTIATDADGDFVVAWTSDGQDGDGNGIYAQRYNADGSAEGNEFQVNTQVNTTTADHQEDPAIAMDADGDFVVAWTSYGQDAGIYARRYGADGSAAGDEFQVNTTTASTQYDPAIGVDADGDFVVAWTSYGQDGDESAGIYAQRYGADGSTEGGEFQVNTTTASTQSDPAIGVDADGDFVVAWTSDGQDGDGGGIYAQRYAADGSPADVEFPVNTETAGNQVIPAIAVDVDGDFVVAWTSYGQDGDEYGVYAQRYAVDGSAAGDEFEVNSDAADAAVDPAIALDADGDFVVAWESYGQDGNEYGIYAQRFVGPEDVDLAVTITDSPDPVTVGNTLTYTLTLDNNHDVVAPTGIAAIDNAIGSATGVMGSAQLSGAAFTLQGFDIPEGSGVTCVPGTTANSVVCTGEDALAAGASLSVGVRVQPNASGMLVGTANATGNQFDSNEGETDDNNTDTEQTTVNAAATDGGGGDTGGNFGPTGRITSIGKDGGCSMSAVPGKPDPTLPALGFLAGLVLVMRRRMRIWRNSVWPDA